MATWDLLVRLVLRSGFFFFGGKHVGLFGRAGMRGKMPDGGPESGDTQSPHYRLFTVETIFLSDPEKALRICHGSSFQDPMLMCSHDVLLLQSSLQSPCSIPVLCGPHSSEEDMVASGRSGTGSRTTGKRPAVSDNPMIAWVNLFTSTWVRVPQTASAVCFMPWPSTLRIRESKVKGSAGLPAEG